MSIRRDADLWVDADEFERLATEARRAEEPDDLLEAADRLYVGEYLPDDVYDEWAIRRRDVLRRLWADLQVDLARSRERRGNVDGAIAALQRLFESDRSDERAVRELMLLHARHDGRSAAMRAYEQHAEALRRFRDKDHQPVEPDPETQRVRREILAGTTPPPGLPNVREPVVNALAPAVNARTGATPSRTPVAAAQASPGQPSPIRRNILPGVQQHTRRPRDRDPEGA